MVSGASKMHENPLVAAGALPRSLLGELTMLPRPTSWWGRRLAAPSQEPHVHSQPWASALRVSPSSPHTIIRNFYFQKLAALIW